MKVNKTLVNTALAGMLMAGNSAKAVAQEVSTQGAKRVTTEVVDTVKNKKLTMADISEVLKNNMDSLVDAAERKRAKFGFSLGFRGSNYNNFNTHGYEACFTGEKGRVEGVFEAHLTPLDGKNGMNHFNHQLGFNYGANYYFPLIEKQGGANGTKEKLDVYTGVKAENLIYRNNDGHSVEGSKNYRDDFGVFCPALNFGMRWQKDTKDGQYYFKALTEGGPAISRKEVAQTHDDNMKAHLSYQGKIRFEAGSRFSKKSDNSKGSHVKPYLYLQGEKSAYSDKGLGINGYSVSAGGGLKFIDQPEAQIFPHWNENFNSMIKK